MKTHRMHLDPAPFEMIRSGEKRFELRLYDEKRRAIRPGDRIEFTNNAGGETLVMKVHALHVFGDFGALYAALPLEECGYKTEELAAASPQDMENYYSKEDIRRSGVVAIELKRP